LKDAIRKISAPAKCSQTAPRPGPRLRRCRRPALKFPACPHVPPHAPSQYHFTARVFGGQVAWKSAPGHTRPFSIRFASPRFRVSGGAIGNQRRNAQEARWRIALDHNDAVSSAAFSPDGSRIVAASRDRTARIWDAASGKEIAVLRHIHGVSTGGHESGLRFALRIHERQPRHSTCSP